MAKYNVDIEGVGSFVIEMPDGAPPPTKEQVWQAIQAQRSAPAIKQTPPLTYEHLRDSFAQGLTFGLADEAAAALGATGDMLRGKTNFAQNYDRRVAEHRANLRQAEKYHPAASLTANVAGGAPWAFLTGGASRGPSVANTAINAVKAGAASGAVAGAGAAEGGPAERAWGAMKGAVVGGAVGSVLPTATRMAGGVTQRLADSFSDSALGQWLGKLPGVRPPGAERGAEKVAQALEKDGLDPLQAAMRADELSVGGKPVVLADAGGASTRRLGRDALNANPHGTSDVVDQLAGRADDAGGRVIEDLVSTTGMRGDAQQVAVALMQQRSTAAQPLYARAYAAGQSGIQDQRIIDLLRRPAFQTALRNAYEMAANNGVTLPRLWDANGKQIANPTLELLDWTKRGLDQVLFSGRRQGSLDAQGQSIIANARRQFVDLIDQHVPDYAKARAAYAGDTAMLEALDLGQGFVRMNPRELNAALAQLTTPGERQHFLLGAVDSIKQAIGASPDGADVVRRVWGSTDKRQKLESLFPSPEAFRDFTNRMMAEKRMRMTWDATRNNSTTAQQAVGLADLADNELMSVVPQVANGNWSGLFERAMNRGRGNLGANAEAALPILFGDPRRGLEQLVRARQLMQRRADAPLRTPVPAGITSGLMTGRQ